MQAILTSGPSLTLPDNWQNGMLMPSSIGKDGTTVALNYSSSTTIQPNTIQVTVSSFTNCYLWNADPNSGGSQYGDSTAQSATVYVVPDPKNPQAGTATFMLATAPTAVAGQTIGFAAQANDAGQAKLNPNFLSGPLTPINEASLSFNIGSSLIPAWDGTSPRPSVSAVTQITTQDLANTYVGIEVIILARGFYDGDDAFKTYVDVYDDSGDTLLTPQAYPVEYNYNSYTAFRLPIVDSFGSLSFTFKPKAPQNSGLLQQGYVEVIGMLADADQQSPGVFILKAQKQPDDQALPGSPNIELTNGLCLEPREHDTSATIWIPSDPDVALVCYALMNQVGGGAPAMLAAQLSEDADIELYNGQKQVKFTVPLANLNVCAATTDQHNCGKCVPSDLNSISYLYLKRDNIAGYSQTASAYLDAEILNEPDPPNSVYASVEVYQGQLVNGQLVPIGNPLVPPTAITVATILQGGLVIRIKDPSVVGKTVQGKVYQNGLATDRTYTHAATKRRDQFDLLKTPTVVPSNPGYLDIPWPQNVVAGYDYGAGVMDDAGFFVVYWDLIDNVAVDYSNVYRTVLNTAYPY
ncbi:hypothetical protein [Bradyrhizobium sp. LHD-71]|uniref:hypothetical protein n=1 Tax=Bradyrhizobium sp. LHD-71 TaxID=3072141 RepID=UPI00280D0785|nr:hypothetical protein [Bradyrhizobium sp. LHD-71]MDQ8730263.1 hypothetical protein [Bradyrhizobium sp. LHD-71]